MQPTDAIKEVFYDFFAEHRMQYFRMELHAVELPGNVFDRCMAAVFRACADAEAIGQMSDLHAMAHPVDGGLVHPFKQRAAVNVGQLGFSILSGFGAAAASAKQMHHKLHSIADTEHRHTQTENLRIQRGCALCKDCGGAAGENDAVRCKGADFV